ncbi:peptide ABC transporter substrate-binding protein [Haloferula sargassicola]|uniref:Solute-binding protein family 5 domain-containing protein n=1 Tax=Haloferula sargassicola TaxID=490096 RepID=A0ABP9UNF7_9BACT
MPRRLFTLAVAALALASCSRESQVERATREGVLIVGNSVEPKGLDPQVVSGVAESNLMRALFEGPVSFDPVDDAAYRLTGAESLEPDETATRWTIHLRPEAQWSDGIPVTARDYVFSYHRMLHPEFGAKYAEMLYFMKNAAAYNEDQRGEILFRISPPAGGPSWDEVSAVQFRPLEKWPEGLGGGRSLAEIKGIEWATAPDGDRKLIALAKGLDSLGKEQLEWIAADPATRFPWPEGFGRGREVIDRLLAHQGQDLWDLAQVGVEEINDLTFAITLRGPTPYFPQILKHYTWDPVPRHVVLQHGKMSDKSNPWAKLENIVTNGPFQLKSWQLTDHIEVERNPLYWNAAEVTLNGVRFLPITNSYTEARMFRDGQLHISYTAPPEVIDLMKEIDPTVLRQEPYVGTFFYRCNTERKPLDNPKVREALALAIDREVICGKILKGYKPAWGITPPMVGYEVAERETRNVEKARKLLAEANFPEGQGFPRLKVLLASRETAATVAQAVQAMWARDLGIQVEIENKEWTAYLEATQTGEYDLASGGWIGDYLDPLTFLEMWTKGNGNNNTGWWSPDFEDLLRQSHQEPDPAKRYELLKRAENLFLDEKPVLIIAWYSRNYLIDPAVKGWNPLLLDNHPYDKIRLEPVAR